MGFHLQHGLHVTLHGMLGLFAPAAPPLPLAGDNDTPGLQGGPVQGGGTGAGAPCLTQAPGVPSLTLPRLPAVDQPSIWDPTLASTPCSDGHTSASSV